MNYADIQLDVLKGAYARETKGKPFLYRYGILKDYICITDTHKLVKIPQNLCFINLETAFTGMPMNMKLICDDSNATRATDTGILKVLDKSSVCIFKIDNSDEEVWVDSKLLKGFDLKHSSFKAINRKNPLYIYENEVMVGLVLPVNHH